VRGGDGMLMAAEEEGLTEREMSMSLSLGTDEKEVDLTYCGRTTGRVAAGVLHARGGVAVERR
jgi:hypothetical protein